MKLKLNEIEANQEIYFEVNEMFETEKLVYKCIEGEGCKLCDIIDMKLCQSLQCSAGIRKDWKSVNFVIYDSKG